MADTERGDAGAEASDAALGAETATDAAMAAEARARTPAMAVVAVDGDGIVRSWSDGARELLGYRAGDAVGRPLAELVVPPPLRRAHEAGLARVRHTGTSSRLGGTFTMPTLRADGSITVLELTLGAMTVGDEEWYLGVLRDPDVAGDRSHSVPSGNVLQAIFERAPEAITVLDAHGRQRTVNRAGARMLGFGDEGRFPGDGRSFVHPDDFEYARASNRAQLEHGEPGRPFRYRVLAGDGSWRWLETLVTDLRDIEEIGGFVAFSRDVTEDEVRRGELATSLARLRAAVEALPAAAIEDAEQRVAHHNARFAAITGHAVDRDLTGLDMRSLLRRVARGATEPEAVQQELARCARSTTATVVGPLTLGDEQVLEVESVPVTQDGAVTGRMWMIRDVTDRVRAEERMRGLLQVEQEARRLAEERTELLHELAASRLRFVSTVSHELRTPLASIVSALDHLLDLGQPSPDVLDRYLRLASRNADRLVRLVDDLLVVGRIDAGLISLVPVPLDVPAVLREVVADLAPAMAPRSISVAFDLEEGPPLLADDLRFRQVIENLVGNALKFGPDKGRITVSCRADDAAWIVDVADEGRGIPTEHRARVFEPFTRLQETESLGVAGTGLGLAIVKGFVELHGGTVSVVDSAVGARIRCRFPLGGPT